MKIIQITTFFHPVTGGVEQQVLEISKQLMEFGHEVQVFTTDSKRTDEKITVKESIVDGIKVKRFKTIFSLSKFYKIVPGMFFELMNTDFDILHVHGFRKFESYIALLAAKLKNKKIVLTTHNPFTTNTRSDKLERFVKIHDKTFGKWFTKYIDKIISIVPSEKDILIKNFGVNESNITVIPNGIDESLFNEININKDEYIEKLIPNAIKTYHTDERRGRKKEWKGIVVSVCRFNKVKGLQNLKLAADKLKNVLFLFVGGDDGYQDELLKLFKDNNNVVMTGFYVSHDDVKKTFSIADIFVLPSLHEPFGLTPLEAIANNCPVIATNIGGTKEVISDKYTIFLNPNDQEVWFNTIKDLLEVEDKRISMQTLGKEDIRKYTWDKIIKKIEEVYKEITKTS